MNEKDNEFEWTLRDERWELRKTDRNRFQIESDHNKSIDNNKNNEPTNNEQQQQQYNK